MTVSEDVKIGVIFARAPPSVQNHCHFNSHILKSCVQDRTMLLRPLWRTNGFCRCTFRCSAKASTNGRRRQEAKQGPWR